MPSRPDFFDEVDACFYNGMPFPPFRRVCRLKKPSKRPQKHAKTNKHAVVTRDNEIYEDKIVINYIFCDREVEKRKESVLENKKRGS